MKNMANPYCWGDEYGDTYKTCKECVANKERLADLSRKTSAVEGLVEVVYGEVPVPDKDGGRGYAYHSDEKLRLGDVVRVPSTWISIQKGRYENIATVVSTFSDYKGSVRKIERVMKNGNRRAAALKRARR